MTVFSATDKLTLDRSKFPPGSEGMGDSYLACWDSHMRVYQEVVDNPAIETALILEDDVDFDFDIVAKVARARAAIGDRPWDIFYLGHCESGWGNPRNALDSFPGVFHSSSPACTHGYAVSKRGARKLVQELTPPNAPVDIMLDNLITRKVLESLAMHPPLITQVHLKGDQSDINPDGKFGYVGDNVDTSAEGRLKLLRQLH
ncbi:hypothetical protein BJ085DRAFT_32286 [Dimargaris cristalligena]|uniref:Glycosyl transferase family 25 domain-containing protein n=1 Tax=Dimargaris cristalligena TaxID=215637 RepID=A0A4P9ZW39_9FUNG|nr:hypothetical protein BJ085DRAFT_32286 [Dimargaris cristalligena]|eukprot:RKP36880.1 hypothetical protein BJ085DRAFT_32286 [Dimargaris cristalligena]